MNQTLAEREQQRGTGSKKSRDGYKMDDDCTAWVLASGCAYCTARVSACSRVLVSLFSPDGGPRRTGNRVDVGAAEDDVPRSSRVLSFMTLLCVPPIRYMPCWSKPYFSMTSQHLMTMGGISTSSRIICSARFTPNVGRPLSDRCAGARFGELPGW